MYSRIRVAGSSEADICVKSVKQKVFGVLRGLW